MINTEIVHGQPIIDTFDFGSLLKPIGEDAITSNAEGASGSTKSETASKDFENVGAQTSE